MTNRTDRMVTGMMCQAKTFNSCRDNLGMILNLASIASPRFKARRINLVPIKLKTILLKLNHWLRSGANQ